jgi:hypothetical protein
MPALSSKKTTLLFAVMLAIGGCGGGSSEQSPGDGAAPTEPGSGNTGGSRVEHQISGSVGDGPVVAAQLSVVSSSGASLAEFSSSSTADYGLSVLVGGDDYPLSITAKGGTDLVTGGPPDFRLVSAVLAPESETGSNLNPFTTLIHGAARHGGRLTAESVANSQAAIMANYSFGLDADAVPDPTATPIVEDNVHHIVKASEALGEMIRRTRDAMAAAGTSLDGDAIVAILSADLVDGYIDGRGAAGADARVAAVANIAAAAVLLEAMANRLHVYGVDATHAMDLAIQQVRPDAPTESRTADVEVTAAALAQAEQSLRAVAAIAPDPRIDAVIDAVAAASPGVTPAEFSALLPEGIGDVIVAAVIETARASGEQLDAINAAARGDASVDPGHGSSNRWATVTWRAPTQRTDGSPVGKINNYTVYYGQSAEKLDRSVKIGAGQTRFQLRNLEPGTWYFAVTATARGVESAKSNIRSKTIS